jgi:hypothetical protein
MKNSIIALAIAFAAVLIVTSTASAQNTGNAYAYGKTKIVAGLSLAKTQDLQFGQIVRSAVAGTVVLDPTSANRVAAGGVTIGQNAGNTAARFVATGEPGYLYTLTLPATIALTKTVTSGTAPTMNVSALTSTLGASGIGTLATDGTQTFSVGGTLNIGASQETGDYQGQFNVVVTYQ